MLPDDTIVLAQRSACDDVTASTDQSHAVIIGQCDVTLSRDRGGGRRRYVLSLTARRL